MGGAYSIGHAACLAAHLPKDSRTLTALEPMNVYGTATNRLLALIEYHAHAGWYVHTEDARKGRNAPKPVFDNSEDKRGKTQGDSLTIEEYEAILAKPRREVQYGN